MQCHTPKQLGVPTRTFLTGWAVVLALTSFFLSVQRASAQAISYTVQVAALSDQTSAESLRRTLEGEGYPAYLVSVLGAQTVYRLRVGAFADRDGADAYAQAMRGVGGTVPVPALAEGIPPNLFPLEPQLVARYPVTPFERLEVVPWGDAAALRTQGRFENEPLIATYRVLSAELAESPFAAWRAAPLPDTDVSTDTVPAEANVLERVTNLPLFAAEEATMLPGGALSKTGQARLLEAAEALGLGEAQIRPYISYEPGRGAPFLVVAERFDPASKTGGRYPALGNPGGRDAAGPKLTWFGQSPPETFPQVLPEPLFSLSSLVKEEQVVPPTGTLTGEGWQAVRDGRFTVLSVDSRRWRAVVGQPLWAGGDFLLVYARPDVVLYQISPPSR